MSFVEKDHLEAMLEGESQFEFKSVNPASIETRDEASRIMYEIDGAIASIQMEVDIAKGAAISRKKFLSPRRWASLNNSLKEAKRKRMSVQDRLALLNRLEKSALHKSREAAFIKSASSLLGPDEYKRIWDHAREENPDLFSGGNRVDS